MINKLCIYCEHFNITSSREDYSDVTGGEKETISCLKSHFYMDHGEIESLKDFMS